MRSSVGRFRGEAELQRPDDDLVAAVVADVAELLGLSRPEPVETRLVRWGGGLPQYLVGHPARVDAIRAAVSAGAGPGDRRCRVPGGGRARLHPRRPPRRRRPALTAGRRGGDTAPGIEDVAGGWLRDPVRLNTSAPLRPHRRCLRHTAAGRLRRLPPRARRTTDPARRARQRDAGMSRGAGRGKGADRGERSVGKRANELNASIRYTMWSVFRLARPLGDDAAPPRPPTR